MGEKQQWRRRMHNAKNNFWKSSEQEASSSKTFNTSIEIIQRILKEKKQERTKYGDTCTAQ